IGGVVLADGSWFNIGSRAQYLDLHQTISRTGWSPAYVPESDWSAGVAPTAKVDPTARIIGCSVVGKACRVEAGAVLDDTIVWPGSQIASRTNLSRCIVRTRKAVSGSHHDIDL